MQIFNPLSFSFSLFFFLYIILVLTFINFHQIFEGASRSVCLNIVYRQSLVKLACRDGNEIYYIVIALSLPKLGFLVKLELVSVTRTSLFSYQRETVREGSAKRP